MQQTQTRLTWLKATALAVVFLLIGMLLASVILPTKTEYLVPLKDAGTMVIGSGSGNGMRLSAVAASDEEQTGTSQTLTATITPADAIEKQLDWTVEWTENVKFWNGNNVMPENLDVTDYVTVTPESDGALTATITNHAQFGTQILVKASVRNKPEIYATCTVDFCLKPSGFVIKEEYRSWDYEEENYDLELNVGLVKDGETNPNTLTAIPLPYCYEEEMREGALSAEKKGDAQSGIWLEFPEDVENTCTCQDRFEDLKISVRAGLQYAQALNAMIAEEGFTVEQSIFKPYREIDISAYSENAGLSSKQSYFIWNDVPLMRQLMLDAFLVDPTTGETIYTRGENTELYPDFWNCLYEIYNATPTTVFLSVRVELAKSGYVGSVPLTFDWANFPGVPHAEAVTMSGAMTF
ncbi:MAG: hypothetical protein J6C93_07780 [Clostridia bacterium]|nr:hypothetical protein [Clostridia bacterium]